MVHPLITQFRFARSEFVRGLSGVSEADAARRFAPMNCIAWIVGHLANQENSYWVLVAQGVAIQPELYDMVGYGKPASTPSISEMWAAWHAVTAAADTFLDTLTPELLLTHMVYKEKSRPESIGTMLLRNTYHYWYHLGEAQAVRQLLGHSSLPDFVGNMSQSVYRPE